MGTKPSELRERGGLSGRYNGGAEAATKHRDDELTWRGRRAAPFTGGKVTHFHSPPHRVDRESGNPMNKTRNVSSALCHSKVFLGLPRTPGCRLLANSAELCVGCLLGGKIFGGVRAVQVELVDFELAGHGS